MIITTELLLTDRFCFTTIINLQMTVASGVKIESSELLSNRTALAHGD